MQENTYIVTGIMSGTSLDGIDLLLSRFIKTDQGWRYEILKSETIGYDESWKRKLTGATSLDAEHFLLLHNEYGYYIGKEVSHFLSRVEDQAMLVASHGHTIFHQPGNKFTFQIGSGACIAAASGITTVSDLRTLDVALGGQGAPLVPVGDRLLFGNYEFCLNLGGFANISNEHNGKRIACDLCPVNFVANDLALRKGLSFDAEGSLGKSGRLNMDLVHELNSLDFFSLTGPRSLGREWTESVFLPVIARYDLPVEDLLRSLYEHISIQISRYINAYNKGRVLVTGGGAFNSYLISLIRARSVSELVIPDDTVVKFKEALIFGFLGLLSYLREVNCYSSVTGADRDSVSGVIWRGI